MIQELRSMKSTSGWSGILLKWCLNLEFQPRDF